ncbi:MAG: alkyl sulfatase BDS1-like metallo-beta-lactamase superfamily hydrolase [Arenicella sp.]|jgi:alkyl sulfatase BDS1-like metallo-beta-lactamase superfamily hydrolase
MATLSNHLTTERLIQLLAFCVLTIAGVSLSGAASEVSKDDSTMSLQQPSTQTEATRITDNIYSASGFGNTFLVVTEQGNVVIDSSLARNAPKHKELLNQVDSAEPKFIIITHAHGDHIGGLPIWTGDNTKVIMQQESIEFMHYQERLKGFFTRRNAAQFGFELADFEQTDAVTGNYDANIPVDITFDNSHSFKLGELSFNVLATPSETHDALSVWIPERKAVFVGDLFYRAFPNLYTLRGTKPRWALDYVNSLDKVIDLKAEILIPSHGDPIFGGAEIKQALEQYRDAILYLHDAVVQGMNEGKSVDTLVSEISLPEALRIPEIYGRVDWSIRGIYLGYAGWFDGNPSTMLGIDALDSASELIRLAGGVDTVASRANTLFDEGRFDEALSLSDVVLTVDPRNQTANLIKKKIYSSELSKTKNFNSAGWLKYGIRESEKAVEASK